MVALWATTVNQWWPITCICRSDASKLTISSEVVKTLGERCQDFRSLLQVVKEATALIVPITSQKLKLMPESAFGMAQTVRAHTVLYTWSRVVDQKGSAAMLTIKRSTGVTPVGTGTTFKAYVRFLSLLWLWSLLIELLSALFIIFPFHLRELPQSKCVVLAMHCVVRNKRLWRNSQGTPTHIYHLQICLISTRGAFIN